MSATCYMCDKLATSKEHVPPLCLFPEQKDTFGNNFRKDLITVPSCDKHNSKKSKDDEFLMVSIAGILGNNYLGYHHTKTKIDRALRRKSKDFLYKAIIKNPKEKTVKIGDKKFPILHGNPDGRRLIDCFNNIAHGLYFHKYRERFQGKVKILIGFVDYNKQNDQTLIKFIRRRFELEERALEEKGQNSKVFTYQFCAPDEFNLTSLKLEFYGYSDIFVAFIPDNTEIPYNLVDDLKKRGIPTVYKLGDEEFHFNMEQTK